MISIAFTGGGTGGHIYPGLAVASWIKKIYPCRIFWIGSSTGMDRAILENAGVEFFGIPSGKLRRYFSLCNFFDAFRVIAGFFAARRLLKREAPSLLFSKGGFVSVPPCAAARTLKIPVFTHESDYSPGLSTRINSRFADRIFIPYKESEAFFHGALKDKICVSGNPIRPEFDVADPGKGRAFLGLGKSERILLVLGGSQGSREINSLVWDCLPQLIKYYTIVHQTGEISEIPEAAIDQGKLGLYRHYDYLRDYIHHLIAAAELVISRGGAGTLWECKSLGKPLVLIPLQASGTSRGDQIENVRLFEKAGAAIYFTGDASALAALVSSLAEDGERRRSMGEVKISGFNAAEFIAKAIVDKIKEAK